MIQEICEYRDKKLEKVPEFLNPNVKVLALGNNFITRIECIPAQIIKLELKENKISKIEGLDALVNIEILDLSRNYIAKIEGLRNCINLREVHLGNNKISLVENLEFLSKLKRLNLENNKLTGATSVRSLSLNKGLEFLVLLGNPIARQGMYKTTITGFIPKLRILDYYKLSRTSSLLNVTKVEEFFSVPFPSLELRPMSALNPHHSKTSIKRELRSKELHHSSEITSKNIKLDAEGLSDRVSNSIKTLLDVEIPSYKPKSRSKSRILDPDLQSYSELDSMNKEFVLSSSLELEARQAYLEEAFYKCKELIGMKRPFLKEMVNKAYDSVMRGNRYKQRNYSESDIEEEKVEYSSNEHIDIQDLHLSDEMDI